MTIHSKIKNFIKIIKRKRQDSIDENDLKILYEGGATATEAAITLHLGFDFSDVNAERFVKYSQLWQPENIQDVAYQTFLYMNYDPDDPNFSYDDDKVKFSLKLPSKENDD